MAKETRVELTTNVTLGKFLSYSSPACETFIANIASRKCYLLETKQEITNDHMLCNGNKYLIKLDKDDIKYNHVCKKKCKTIWDKLHGRIKLKISSEDTSVNGDIKMYIPDIDNLCDLKETISKGGFNVSVLNSIETLVDELLSMTNMVPLIEMSDVYVYCNSKVKLAPFSVANSVMKTEFVTNELLGNIISYYSKYETDPGINERLSSLRARASKIISTHLDRKRRYEENCRDAIEECKKQQKRASGLFMLDDYTESNNETKMYDCSEENIILLAWQQERMKK